MKEEGRKGEWKKGRKEGNKGGWKGKWDLLVSHDSL